MKGIVLAGGFGTRLEPLTTVLNKHLLPVYNQPMIFYPLQCLARSGVEDVLLLTGGKNSDLFPALLGNGRALGLRSLHYAEQDRAGGIAYALELAEEFADGQSILLMLGDNILQYTIERHVQAFHNQGRGARILLGPVDHPQAYGIAELDGERIVQIIEKPKDPPGNMAVIGVYLYDHAVFEIARTLGPSRRGELEITAVNNAYIEKGGLEFSVIDGWWRDAAENIDQYLACCNLVAREGANLRNED